MKLKVYVEEAYEELVHKVTWPTWKELQSSAFSCDGCFLYNSTRNFRYGYLF
jgi:hypothetical protein